MGKTSDEQIWNFAREFAKEIYEIDEYWLNDEEVRTRERTLSMYYLSFLAEAEQEGDKENCIGGEEYYDGWYESDDRLEDIIPRVTEDETIEAVMFCEGDLWETLYYYEAYGSNNDKTKAIYEAFVKATENNDLWYEWGAGIIYLYGVS